MRCWRNFTYFYGARWNQRRFDCILTSTVSQSTNVPTIASGGVGTLEHFSQGVLEGKQMPYLPQASFTMGN